MSGLPLVSCILDAPRAAEHAAEAAESVLQQTYPHLELVLLCDRDLRPELPAAGLRGGDAIKVLELPPPVLGCGEALNAGIRASRGECIAFLRPSDAWLPAKLERQVQALRDCSQAAGVCGRPRMWYSWSGRPEDALLDHLVELGVAPGAPVQPPLLLEQMVEGQYQTASLSDLLLRRSALRETGEFEDALPIAHAAQRFLAVLQLLQPLFVSGECWTRQRCVRRDGETPNPSEAGAFLAWVAALVHSRRPRERKLLLTLREQHRIRSPDWAAGAIRSNFPGLRLDEIAFLAEGAHCAAYRVNGQYVFKFPKSPEAEAGLLRESAVLRLLESYAPGAQVPRLRFVGNPHRRRTISAGASAAGLSPMHRLRRRFARVLRRASARAAPLEGGVWEGAEGALFIGYVAINGGLLYPEAIERMETRSREWIAQAVGRGLRLIHSVPLLASAREALLTEATVEAQERAMLAALSAMERSLPGQTWCRLQGFISRARTARPGRALLHGDLCWDHMRFCLRSMTFSGFIDFGSSCVGDPHHDLVPAFESYGRRYVGEVIRHYGDAGGKLSLQRVGWLALCKRAAPILKESGGGVPTAAAIEKLAEKTERYLC